jgi:hypothetical protein
LVLLERANLQLGQWLRLDLSKEPKE